jgi:hypothetical protein
MAEFNLRSGCVLKTPGWHRRFQEVVEGMREKRLALRPKLLRLFDAPQFPRLGNCLAAQYAGVDPG